MSFSTAFNVAWTSNDPAAVFRLQRAVKTPGGALGAYTAWGNPTTLRTFLQKGAKPGWSYCYRVQASDPAGNPSAWSAPRCATLPLDDRSLAGKLGWTRPVGKPFYLGTVSLSKVKGAALGSARLRAGRIAVVVTKRPGGGVVGVYVGGKRVALLPTASKKAANRQVVPVRVRLTGNRSCSGLRRPAPRACGSTGSSPWCSRQGVVTMDRGTRPALW